MASEEELERIRARRLAELQSQQQQNEQIQRAQEEAEAQKQALMRKILTPEARQRMTNIKMVRPEYGEQLELQLLQLAQTGRIKIPIDDDVLKRLLSQLQGSSRREINIRRV
ncbi:MAG: DNA-binding protein [Candidatus Thorarchaeota archaeon]|nr:DNA-binding protein [Candidatus Thorarchaeota archaeon]NIW14005.1 DNA-binding protein [Candidatus Thorarchaeota archaeon]